MRTDWLGNIGIQLILEDPFWGWLYRQLPRKLDEKVEEVSLVAEEQDGLTIAFHPSLEKKSHDPFFLTQVKHELLHFLLAHPLQRQQAAQKRYFDLAADLCVDQFLAAYPGSLKIQDFSGFALVPHRSAQTYYRQFLNITEEGLAHQIATLEGCLLRRQKQVLKHEAWSSPDTQAYDFDRLFNSLQQDLAEPTLIQWPERLWPLFSENLPVSKANTLNWRDQLQWLVRTSRHTQLVYKKNKRSRRYGVSPGIKIKRKHRLLVALDTSGSVRAEELQLFFQEIHRLFRQGVEIEILECDVDIQRRYPYKGWPPEAVAGRGDTNYQPAIELFNEETDFGGLIYFTDGEGPPPFVEPKRPMLWVISREGERKKYEGFPGKIVPMAKNVQHQ
jgi:predicted metal-dependent peptidase